MWVHQMVDGRDHRRLPARRLGGRIEGLQLWRVPQALRHGLAAAAATRVVVLNDEDGERIVRWQRVRREKIHVVPHGVDLERFRFDGAGRERLRREWNVTDDVVPIVGTAGRLVPGKGIERLIEVAARLRDRGINLLLVIAGEGPQRAAGVRLAERLGVAEAVRWAGFVEDMAGYYSALDVFALCSATESFGLAVAEAMACERVVIGTPTAGARRQIEHGRTGWQLEGFGVDELADGLAALLGRRGRFAEMGRRARASVARRFSIDRTLDRTLRALGMPVGRGAAGRPCAAIEGDVEPPMNADGRRWIRPSGRIGYAVDGSHTLQAEQESEDRGPTGRWGIEVPCEAFTAEGGS